MEKLGMNFGGGPSKKELQELVETQRKQLLQYQTRLKDVVRAYKSLLKEKEALEASLHVLSTSQDPGTLSTDVEEPHDDQHSTHSEDSIDTAGSLPSARGGETSEDERQEPAQHVGGVEEASGSESGVSTASGEGGPSTTADTDRRIVQLKNQLATLTSALATVTQEKSRMEASYQADKRKAKQEMEEMAQRMEEEHNILRGEIQGLQVQLAENRDKLISQQYDRAQEQADHAVMLKELQRLLQGERDLRQEVELHLEEARQELAGRSELAVRAEATEEQSKKLRREIEELKKELLEARKQRTEPDPMVQELQDELCAVKKDLEALLQEERCKRLEEHQYNQQRFLQEEERIRTLESQVSELSELLGAAETAKQRDQVTIRKLRERLLQLETENKTIAMATSMHPPTETLVMKSSAGEDIEDSPEQRGSALFYQQELQQVKEEFERYKARAQGVLRTKGAREGELEAGKQKLAELKDKYLTLRLSFEEAENKHKAEMEAARKELVLLAQTHRQDLEEVRKESRENMARMEEELRQQRERVLAVLYEKEQELERLRETKIPVGVYPPSPDPLENGLELPQNNSSAFLVYIDQVSRKEAEIGNLRRKKHELEAELQNMQSRLAEKNEETHTLREQVNKAMRDKSREGANMEYLKNVLLGFLTLPDPLGRQHTLSALLTVLHFSPEERNAALRAQDGSRWWAGTKR
ncbi:GRIP and coiled-coil domain-containing protein 1 [Hyla sarda]|uniref:GRIP and coiled-coil domain-containing protein 1 n=1 Tax=Hyla sarda TaxID=327740 RepID=UPI0024C237C5|nr:GRIP and coiled-coil domain-containing protein 1 [Hyla sarda]XP_056429039.1 GRIP and coiled-coil domain-containing protein 1 [Hyla sarda]XP_056429040.1 GRIP and coiled-coil domain-containing protein 1 [Hyla sarda]XP_056429041.1 GRIP and coiled-coil domain-containing protein 1 [Hyla sarda]XP_056429043.1 GRIP and coiled-coil domain-containing protein 1 [Hyla sarda]XP_056429044.1 GRIP and coiled-coil domain-containing protein 1 [Hyla sarda]XP_056429045.1 GRIP and coiled-coil domain-containing